MTKVTVTTQASLIVAPHNGMVMLVIPGSMSGMQIQLTPEQAEDLAARLDGASGKVRGETQ